MTSRFGMRSDWSYHFDLEIKKIFTIFRFPCFRVYHFKPPYLNLRRSTVFVLVSDHSWTFMNVLIECWITGKLLKSSRMRNFRKFSNPLIFNFRQNHQSHQKIPKISLFREKKWIYLMLNLSGQKWTWNVEGLFGCNDDGDNLVLTTTFCWWLYDGDGFKWRLKNLRSLSMLMTDVGDQILETDVWSI